MSCTYFFKSISRPLKIHYQFIRIFFKLLIRFFLENVNYIYVLKTFSKKHFQIFNHKFFSIVKRLKFAFRNFWILNILKKTTNNLFSKSFSHHSPAKTFFVYIESENSYYRLQGVSPITSILAHWCNLFCLLQEGGLIGFFIFSPTTA